jgi:ribonuclease VapC
MVIDTSAIFALIAGEPEAPRFRAAILAASSVSVSAVSLLEVRTVLHGRLGTASVQHFEVWLAETGATVLPFDREQADAAFDAFRQSGKGQGHPAQLNSAIVQATPRQRRAEMPCCSKAMILKGRISRRRVSG